MNGYLIFWIIIIIFSLASFTYMSVRMLYKGIPELRDMFKQLKENKSDSTSDISK